MPELRVKSNRIDGRVAVRALHEALVRKSGHQSYIELPVSDQHFIELHLPPGADRLGPLAALAEDLLLHFAELDNDVQRRCAEECERSPYDAINYECELAYVTLVDEQTAVLHDDGTVNTDRDEPFSLVAGKWLHALIQQRDEPRRMAIG